MLAFGFAFNSSAVGIQIYNGTDHTVFVKVSLNDGTDCVLDSWITVCVAAGTRHTQTIFNTPFTVRVWTQSMSCTPVVASESWQHNTTWTGCTLPPVDDNNPYTMTWYHMTPSSWGINIEVT